MTFTHLMNCFALTYGPIYAIYSGSRISDYSSSKLMGKCLLYYIAFAVTKMILYATIIPYNVAEGDTTVFSQDVIKNMIHALEIGFLYYCLQLKNNYSENDSGLKILTISLSWSFIDSLCNNLFYFLLNATGEEFTWEYIQTSLLANIELIEKIGIVALVECVLRLNNEKRWNLHLVMILLGKYALNGVGYKYLKQLQFDCAWERIGFKAIVAIVFGIVCKGVFGMNAKDEDALAEEAYYNEVNKKKVQ